MVRIYISDQFTIDKTSNNVTSSFPVCDVNATISDVTQFTINVNINNTDDYTANKINIDSFIQKFINKAVGMADDAGLNINVYQTKTN